uniref:Uncharacterized protein n=1 Tax=Trichuris muris TaxID=70415 RepID=A0A5S6QVV1_TRIMR
MPRLGEDGEQIVTYTVPASQYLSIKLLYHYVQHGLEQMLVTHSRFYWTISGCNSSIILATRVAMNGSNSENVFCSSGLFT